MEPDEIKIPQIKPDEIEVKPVYMDIPKEPNIPTQNTQNVMHAEMNRADRKPTKNKKPILIVLGILLLVIIINTFLIANFVLKAKALVNVSKEAKASVATKDFKKLKESLDKVNVSVINLEKSYTPISWMRAIPFLGKYVGDAGHFIRAGKTGLEVGQMLIQISEPYADLIGFSGQGGAEDGQKTAADRIDFIVKTIPQVMPKMGDIETKLEIIEKEMSYVEPLRYPVKFRGFLVRENLEAGLLLLDQASSLIKNGKPLIEKTTYLLGLDAPRTYLILFQNDKELRPTGGFITAYSIMKVDKAKFEPVESNDIYNLDAKYKPSIPAPDPIIKYIRGPYVLNKNLRLRDMNWSPDFAESMKLFAKEIESTGIKNIDGIIGVDTGLLVNLLNVLGPIGVSGYGNFSNEIVKDCNCPQVIFELESFADVEGPVVWDPAGTGKIIYAPPNMDNRKKIIGPLMNSIMSNVFAQPKNKLPLLIEAMYKSVMEKHVLLYTFDEATQKAAEGFGIAGKVSPYEGDYFQIVDSNLGGRKSNLYVTQEVNQVIVVGKDGALEKTIEITYKNPEKQDGWLNSVLPNWVRIYVPKGSELISFDGVEDKTDPYEDLGKTVFAGYFELRPQGVSKVTLKYKLPFKADKVLKMLVQKQPGTDGPLYTIKVGKKTEEFLLKTDKELNFKI
jgi:hypothetical protein